MFFRVDPYLSKLICLIEEVQRLCGKKQYSYFRSILYFQFALTLSAPTQQNGQTHSTIRRLLLTNCLSVFDHFVRLAFKGLMISQMRSWH